ncbi:hypothetical protein KY290_024780 [Solanum tuberosum]|uniref:RING-type E3 ubiquitin transferase n=1 Tax=Solanum tuberosum TaxID=4113 RepID=A0ABQ7UUS5_SOLTU|nr:hypothetical protein KY284_023639 [Solanum tuberosum]KAH0754510.1 hypothetical protein KY290_024780 [Solanum tuberosum]
MTSTFQERDDDVRQAILKRHTRIKVGLRLLAFYLSIKTLTYQLTKSTCVETKTRCSICLDDYYNKKILTEINCGYLYHFDCIIDWIKLKNSCPICKRDVTVTIN